MREKITTTKKISRKQLLEQIDELRARLEETEQTLTAIRNGNVDALVIEGEGGPRVYTLEGPDSPYRSIVETMTAGAVTINAAYTVLYCNAFFSRMIGLPMARVIGSSFLDLVPHEYQKVFIDFIDLCRVEMCTTELLLRTTSGKTLFTQLAGGPEFLDRRNTCIVVTDISARKRAEEDLRTAHDELEHRVEERTRALRDSERLYRAIGESIDYGVWVCTPEGRNIYASESFLKMVGLTQEQCSNFGWADVLHSDDVKRTIAQWDECVRTGGTWDVEHRFRGADGQWHPVLARGVAVKNDRDEVVYWAGISLDISRIKRAEEEREKARALAENRARELEALMDAVPALVLIAHDPEGRYITGNRFTHDMLGVPLRGNISKSVPPGEMPATYRVMRDGKDIPVDQLPVQQAARGAEIKDCELDLVFPDGAKRTVRGNATPFKALDGSITGAVGAFIDITERRLVEEGLDVKSRALEEVNTALRVLLKQREGDKTELEANILMNVEELVLPHVAKLKKTRLDPTQQSVVGVIEDNLKQITSPIIRTLQTFGLTPMEIEIVSYIKAGKTAKQAAELLGISPRTLEGHRYNIRKKLGLDQKKVNLRSFLLSIP